MACLFPSFSASSTAITGHSSLRSCTWPSLPKKDTIPQPAVPALLLGRATNSFVPLQAGVRTALGWSMEEPSLNQNVKPPPPLLPAQRPGQHPRSQLHGLPFVPHQTLFSSCSSRLKNKSKGCGQAGEGAPAGLSEFTGGGCGRGRGHSRVLR